MADYSQTTRLFIGKDLLQAPPGDKFLRAVQRAVAGDFEVLGELGRGAKGKIVYLARETASRHLVALQLVPGDGGPDSGELWLDVLRKLDGNVPTESQCPRCGHKMQGWGRFCSQCGADLSGVGPGNAPGASADKLLDAVKQAAGSKYELVGEMERSEGGGVVYFAKERASGKIVALRLQKDKPAADGRERYNLGQTMMLNSVVSSLLGPEPAAPTKADSPMVTMGERRPPPSPAPTPAQPQRGRVLLYGAGVLGVLVLVGVLVAGLRGRRAGSITRPDSAAADTSGRATVDSGEIQVGGTLPAKTTVTLNGASAATSSFRLPPGSYLLKAVAPGFTSVEQQIQLKSGQTVVWTPHLTRAKVTTPGQRAPPVVTTPRPKPNPPPVTDDTLVINKAPAARPAATADTLPGGPYSTGAATCASLFSNLEWSRALQACETEANAGSTAAQRTVGTMYERGLATEANPSTAALWYAKAAEGGDRIAQYRLGLLLRSGKGVKKDQKAALAWFRKAAEQGEAGAQYAIAWAYDEGQGVKRSRTTAATWYRQAADQGVSQAQYRLGQFYAKGEAGLPKSEPDAIKWFRLAAAQGHKDAQEEMARRGVPTK